MRKRNLKFDPLEARRLLAAHTTSDIDFSESEPNNRSRQADVVGDINPGETTGLIGEVSSRKDRDYFRVTAAEDGVMHFEVVSDFLARVTVEDLFGNTLAETEPRINKPHHTNEVSVDVTAGEDLLVRVRGRDKTTGEYTVLVDLAMADIGGGGDTTGTPTGGTDDGTPDQGTGDAPGTPTGGTDDGTPDQGTGDAPGTPTGGTDDGTPDQGTGDAPGTPTGGTDDGTPDQGTGDAPGTPTGGTDDGTPDQGTGDAPGTPTGGTDDGTPDQGTGDAPGTPTGGTDDGTPDHGTGDAPGTPTGGTDDGTPDQGTGDAHGTPTDGNDDGTADPGSGDTSNAVAPGEVVELKSELVGPAGVEAEAKFETTATTVEFKVELKDAAENTSFEVRIDGVLVGTLETDSRGRGRLVFEFGDDSNPFPGNFPTITAGSIVEVGTDFVGTFQLDRD